MDVFLIDLLMAQIMAQKNRKSVAYTFRLPLKDFEVLEEAENCGLSYRTLTKLAVRHFIESGAIDELKTQKVKQAA